MFYLKKAWQRVLWSVFLMIELGFFFANIDKFVHGGWVPLLMATLLSSVMFIWYSASKIKARLTEFVKIDSHLKDLKELSGDNTVGKYSTHLAFLSNATRASEIESKIIYSIFEKRPKRADIYWFIHVDTTDDPYTKEYKVDTIAPDDVYKITFKLGFKVPQKINLYFKEVLKNMVETGEVDIRSRYESLNKMNVIGDIRFVVLEKFLSYDNDLSFYENAVMKTYFFLKGFTPTEDKWFGLDTSAVKVEKVPMVIKKSQQVDELKRIE
jgi:KUP system potassium uptake protein